MVSRKGYGRSRNLAGCDRMTETREEVASCSVATGPA
jgi:hypothetical protein